MLRSISILILLIISTAFSSAQKSSIQGRVTSQDGDSLQGVSVAIEGSYKGGYTDRSGHYRIQGLKPGTYILKAEHVGYKEVRREVQLNDEDRKLDLSLEKQELRTDEVTVSGTRVDERDPIPTSHVDRQRIEEENLAPDMPYLLEHTPSAFATSDAGAGVGYTNLRIRGSAPSRINVTINGIPLNDAESQGVFWVNMPDLAASTDDIQIQRGVGSSTNGPGAFGATVNIRTTQNEEEAYASSTHSYGSFNTRKHNVRFGTGLIGEHWNFEGRLSQVSSDGYIDRASSELRSYYFSGSYRTAKSRLQFLTFSGNETTYHAWYGMPEASLDSNRTYNPYDYEDQTDNYTQTHYQLHYDQTLSPDMELELSLHYTKGEGYFEQYRGDAYNNGIAGNAKEALSDYGLEPIRIGDSTITHMDLIRQRWLDNDFYGGTFALNHQAADGLDLTLGGAWNQYAGQHFGEIVWAEHMKEGDFRHRYYDNDALKTDFNSFLKAKFQLDEHWRLFGDLQFRRVSYAFLGIDQDGAPLHQKREYSFINPKAGLSYRFSNGDKAYASYFRGGKEPNRTDHVDAPPAGQPSPERMNDYELGYEHRGQDHAASVNIYYMDYQDQLVQTGKVNEVGREIRVNVPRSFRRGIEFQGGWGPHERLDLSLNFTYSQNRIERFTEFVDDFDEGGQKRIERKNTPIAFSPDRIGAGRVKYTLLDKERGERAAHELSLNWDGKYVGQQHIDNTGSQERSLDPYLVQDLTLSYQLKGGIGERMALRLRARNLFDAEYVNDAWSYRYHAGGEFQQSAGYFPQAGRHYMGSLSLYF